MSISTLTPALDLDAKAAAELGLAAFSGCSWAASASGFQLNVNEPSAVVDPRILEDSVLVDAEFFYERFPRLVHHVLAEAGDEGEYDVVFHVTMPDVRDYLVAEFAGHYGL